MQQFVAEIENANATLVAISPQLPEYSKKIKADHKLSFDLLFDQGNEVAAQFNLKYEFPEYLVDIYRDQLDIDLEKYNGDDQWALPIPARFLIDQQQTIRYAECSADYTQRPDPDELLTVLSQLAN